MISPKSLGIDLVRSDSQPRGAKLETPEGRCMGLTENLVPLKYQFGHSSPPLCF